MVRQEEAPKHYVRLIMTVRTATKFLYGRLEYVTITIEGGRFGEEGPLFRDGGESGSFSETTFRLEDLSFARFLDRLGRFLDRIVTGNFGGVASGGIWPSFPDRWCRHRPTLHGIYCGGAGGIGGSTGGGGESLSIVGGLDGLASAGMT